MPIPVTTPKLRQNVYRIIDGVIATGEAVETRRRGCRLRIMLVAEDGPPKLRRRLDSLTARPEALRGDPPDIMYIGWLSQRRP